MRLFWRTRRLLDGLVSLSELRSGCWYGNAYTSVTENLGVLLSHFVRASGCDPKELMAHLDIPEDYEDVE